MLKLFGWLRQVLVLVHVAGVSLEPDLTLGSLQGTPLSGHVMSSSAVITQRLSLK